jgi:hypothetical protein
MSERLSALKPFDDCEVYSNLRESTIVPKIALVRETVADESKLALLGILL